MRSPPRARQRGSHGRRHRASARLRAVRTRSSSEVARLPSAGTISTSARSGYSRTVPGPTIAMSSPVRIRVRAETATPTAPTSSSAAPRTLTGASRATRARSTADSTRTSTATRLRSDDRRASWPLLTVDGRILAGSETASASAPGTSGIAEEHPHSSGDSRGRLESYVGPVSR
jgi:hypothetical protein